MKNSSIIPFIIASVLLISSALLFKYISDGGFINKPKKGDVYIYKPDNPYDEYIDTILILDVKGDYYQYINQREYINSERIYYLKYYNKINDTIVINDFKRKINETNMF